MARICGFSGAVVRVVGVKAAGAPLRSPFHPYVLNFSFVTFYGESPGLHKYGVFHALKVYVYKLPFTSNLSSNIFLNSDRQ